MVLSDEETVVAHKLTVKLVEKAITTTCVTCDQFEKRHEICNQFKLRPPAKTIACGCIYYVNSLPF